MRTFLPHYLMVAAIMMTAGAVSADPLGTAFTYQGNLSQDDLPVGEDVDLIFSLWDDSIAGAQVGGSLSLDNIYVNDGLFTVELDFGPDVFEDEARWLQIAVRTGDDPFTTLSPRQALMATPTASFALESSQWRSEGLAITNANAGNVGIGTSSPDYMLHVVSDGEDGHAIFGSNTAASGVSHGVSGQSDSTAGRGVFGEATATSGFAYGVQGQSDSTSGRGVSGEATATSGISNGVYGESASVSGRGVSGYAYASTGTNFGVHGQSNSTSGRGVYGVAINGSGINYGVYGESTSTSGRGVFGEATATSGNTHGVFGESKSTTGRGVFGLASSTSGAGIGVEGRSTTGAGVLGFASAASGINYGVYGSSSSTSGFDFYADGAGANYGASSSIRWKTNIEPIDQPLAKIARLRGVYYDWDAEHGGHHDVGMIAEEVGAILPEIVQYEDNGIDAIGMDYSKLTPLLVEAMKELRAEKDAEIARLNARNEQLERRLEALERAFHSGPVSLP